MYLNFGEWAPDKADVGTDTLDTAQNVFPGSNAWLPAKALVTTAAPLPDTCRGLSDAPQESGSFATYAGTTTRLYRFNAATQAWEDVTRLTGGAYAVPTNGYWSFAKFGTLLLATNGSDPIQFINVNSGTNFAALPGNPPLAQHVTVVEDRVMLAGLVAFPTSIAWSDINDSGVWTPGLGLADQQEFSSGGNTQAVCSAARLVIQERGLRAIIPTGDVTSFQFEEIASEKGAISARSVVEVGGLAFWLAEDGFYMGNTAEQRAISASRVAGYFFGRLHRARKVQIEGAAEPLATRIYWAYPTADTEYNDAIIGYDWSLDRWFELAISTYALASTARSSITMEGLDAIAPNLDELMLTLDSAQWVGGVPVFSVIDVDQKLASFDGTPMQAVLETGNVQFVPGRRAKVLWGRPVIEGTGGSSVTIEVGRRQRLADDVAWTTPSPMATSGRVPLYAGGAFHRFRMTIPAGADWTHTQGMDVEAVVEGVR